MKKTKDIMRRLLAMGLAAILLAGSVQTGAYAEGKDAPEATTVVSESAEESESSSTEEVTETEETGKGSTEELSDEEREIATDEETSTEDLTEETSVTEKETVVEEGSEKGSKKKQTVELLSGTSTYTNLIPTSSDNDSALASKAVTFNGIKWYIIADDSTSDSSGIVTLFAQDPIGLSEFHASSDAYGISTIRSYLDGLTTGSGSFAGVANAIVGTDLLDVGVSDAKLFLLSHNEVTNLPTNVRKNHSDFDDDRRHYWLRSSGESGSGSLVMYVSGNGVVNENGDDPDWELGVRPALKLDLACVNFSNKTFTVNTSVRVVSISGGANATASGGNLRQIVTGAITNVSYTANDGFCFKEFASKTTCGITITRADEKTVTVSGTPTDNVSITVPDAVGKSVYNLYADLIPKNDDDDETLATKRVAFGKYQWYIIDVNSTGASEGSVTLLSVESIGERERFNSEFSKGNKYSTSDIKIVVDALTETGGALEDVADAIKTVNIVTKGYDSDEIYDTANNVKCYLLDYETAKDLPRKLLRCANNKYLWWLRSPGDEDYRAADVEANSSSPYASDVGSSVKNTFSVRPALQLDLTAVIFAAESRAFIPPTGYSVTVSGGANATASGGNKSQTGLTGEMTPVTYTADEGYRFEVFEDIIDHGITVTRTDDKTIIVSGTPSYNVNITVPSAVLGYSVTISGGANATADPTEGLSQTGVTGEMIPVTYTANEGYGFAPFEDINDHGITVTRTDIKTVTVSGTPAADVNIIVPDAVTPHDVILTGGTHASVSPKDGTSQVGLIGAMTTVTYTAKTGFRFPEFEDINDHGITVKRVSETTVTVSGTPTADVNITVPDAAGMVARVTYGGISTEYDKFYDAVATWNAYSGATLTLLEDIEIPEYITVEGGTKESPRILDLNGYGILSKDVTVISVLNGDALRLIDSNDAATTRYIITDEDGRGISVSDEEPSSGNCIPVQGGYIAGGTRGGIIVIDGGYFELFSGTILANGKGNSSGAGVNNSGEFVMNGGAIIYNYAYSGGGVYLGTEDATFAMNGGEISHNKTKAGHAIAFVDGIIQKPSFNGAVFAGEKSDGSDAHFVSTSEAAANCNDYEYIRVETGLWHDPVAAVSYTGKAINPDVKVYYGTTLLEKNKDYTIKFSNNTNAGTEAKFTITGKGNYKGTVTDTFEIKPAGISEYYESGELSVSDIPDVDYSEKKSYKPVPTVKYNGKKLKKDKDFKLSYTDTNYEPATPKEPGYYYVRIDGINNFDGYLLVYFYICDKTEIRVSKLTIEKIADQEYTGRDIEPEPVVKYGGTVLKEYEDYVLVYDNNVDIGTGIVEIYGMTPYFGRRDVTFKIKGIPMNKVTVSGIPKSETYDGSEHKPAVTLSYKAGSKASAKPINWATEDEYEAMNDEAKKDIHCLVSYSNNVNSGTATVTLKGINGCSGTVKKTFKITPFDASKGKDRIKISEPVAMQEYAKSGAAPKVKVEYKNGKDEWITLEEGTDYKLSYANNKQVSDGKGNKAPTVTVTGKGNFKGTNENLKCTFAIDKIVLSDAAVVAAKDVVYKNKKGNWKSSVTVTDSAGKKLKAGTDYDKVVKYYKVEGETETELGSKDKLSAGDVVKVVVTAKGKNYIGEAETTYRILAAGHDISKLKVSVPSKEFTGRNIRITKDDITFKSGKKVIKDVEFEIDEKSYKNNINKGKATVVIRGTGEWGGSKTVTYTIGAKGLFWVWSDR